jgi:hypothetical protein
MGRRVSNNKDGGAVLNDHKRFRLNEMSQKFGKSDNINTNTYENVVDPMSNSEFDYVIDSLLADENQRTFPRPIDLERRSRHYASTGGGVFIGEDCYFCDDTGYVLTLKKDNTQTNLTCKCSKGKMIFDGLQKKYHKIRSYFEVFPNLQFEDPGDRRRYNDNVLFQYWKGVAMKSNKTEGNLEIKEVLKKYPNANTDLPF